MTHFLEYVAKDLVNRNLDLSKTAIVFPNKRASLFFEKYLADIADVGRGGVNPPGQANPAPTPAGADLQSVPKPQPNYITINDLFSQFSTLEIADPILLNNLLYKVYKRFLQTDETFDEFYFWGELLLRDFDDLDKQLVDAKQLFLTVQNIKAIENPMQYLTDEQIQALNQFFVNFDPQKNSELKERFIQIWSVLNDIYEQFSETLKSQNLAYDGLLMRDVVENKLNNQPIDLPFENYVFVGFNALNVAEEKLFQFFKNNQNALFYWDYDESFFKTPNHEAGLFIKRNLENFGNALSDPAIFKAFETSQKTKRITFVASPTENAQTRFANDWLKQTGGRGEVCSPGRANPAPTQAHENAIVLCNETLLTPLVSALSEGDDANITMGYPVTQTPIVGRLRHVLSQSKNSEKSPKKMLQDIIELLETELKSDSITNELFQETTFRVVLQLNRVADLIENHQLELTVANLRRLIDQMLSTLTVPFLGEPVLGTQIMGVLETRNLDFKNLLMLSVNEGMLPKSANDGSFIPYALRKAFGMATPEQKSAIFAYHFFRLIQRVENIALVYNTATEGLNRGEMSRFMLQLMIENGFEIEHKTLSAPAVELQQPRTIKIPKTPEIRKILLEKYGTVGAGSARPGEQTSPLQALSPSAINTFLTCKLKFYLHYVVGLRAEKQDVSEMNPAVIGTWFHRSAEILYRKISNQLTIDETNKKFIDFVETLVNAEDLEVFLNDAEREKLVDLAFVYENNNDEYSGEHLIVRRLLTDNLKRLIQLDIQKTPFTLLAKEKKISTVVEFDDIAINIGGLVDRMDNVDGYLRVVDYKTGGRLKPLKTDKLHELFDEKKIAENKNYLQVLIYCWLIAKTSENCRILPCLLHIHEAHTEHYSPTFLPNDFNEISEEFDTLIRDVLNEMFDPNTEFSSTETPANCRYCDYLNLCRRKVIEF